MKKRGFTLIELLAVIVVLAIIALIATPIVMNIIKSAKKEAAERSAERYLKSIETVFASERLDGDPMDEGTYTISGGKITKDGQEYTVEVTSTVPEKGTVIINRNGTVEVESLIVDGHLCLTKENRIDCNKTENKSASTTDSILTLKDGKETYLTDYKIYGNSFQQTYTGKNLFDINKVILSNGNIISADDSSLEFSYSESVSDFFAFSYWLEVEPNTNYSISMNTDSLAHIYFYSDKLFGTTVAPNTSSKNTTATFNSGDNERVLLGFYSIKGYRDGSGKEIVSNIQIEKGSTATTYEPYVGGIPAPNPEYPQEIVSLGNLVTDKNSANYGKYEIPIKVTGKNLFDISKLSSVSNITNNGNGTLTVSAYSVSSEKTLAELSPDLKVGDTAILSAISDGSQFIFLSKSDSQWKFNKSRTITQDDLDSTVYFYCKRVDDVNTTTTISNIQIEIGSNVTSYEPYQKRTYSIYLDEPLRKLGDYKDYIDFEKGEVVRVIQQGQLNGNTKFSQFSSVTNHSAFYTHKADIVDYDTNGTLYVPVLSNKLQYYACGTCNRNNNWTSNYQIGGSVTTTYTRIAFSLPNTVADVESAKIWLGNNPIDYFYPTSEPSHASITLPKIKLFDGVNHITVGTNIAAGEISVNYYN